MTATTARAASTTQAAAVAAAADTATKTATSSKKKAYVAFVSNIEILKHGMTQPKPNGDKVRQSMPFVVAKATVGKGGKTRTVQAFGKAAALLQTNFSGLLLGRFNGPKFIATGLPKVGSKAANNNAAVAAVAA